MSRLATPGPPDRATLLHVLHKYWGHSAFRSVQLPAITAVLNGEDALALMPTGGGKSLCYQLPALFFPGCTLVVSPLIALMEDQVSALQRRGIPAASMGGQQSEQALWDLLQQAAEGSIKLLYTSPERLQSQMMRTALPDLNLSAIAVDEAHCISQWGHDFRPEYRQLATIRQRLPRLPILALTASATPLVANDILEQLRMRGRQVFRESFRRSNIYYKVLQPANKDEALTSALGQEAGRQIVYVGTRRQASVLAKKLAGQGLQAFAYHAGLEASERKDVHAEWAATPTGIMVATTAFGMGIDQPDVRQVIHYELPENLERYYQETGRAGRDGKPSRAILLYYSREPELQLRKAHEQFPGPEALRQVYQSVAEHLKVNIGDLPSRSFEIDEKKLAKAFGYAPGLLRAALRQLSQEGLWSYGRQEGKVATAQLLLHPEELPDLRRSWPEAALLVTWLLRLYAHVMDHPAPIDEKELSSRCGCSRGGLTQMLQRLDAQDAIRFAPGHSRGSSLQFLHRRVDSQYLLLDTRYLEQRRKAHLAQLAAMQAFALQPKGCRTQTLLDYFGETEIQPCGHCDLCDAVQQQPQDLEAQVLHFLKEWGKALPLSKLSLLLPDHPPATIGACVRRLADRGDIRFTSPTMVSISTRK